MKKETFVKRFRVDAPPEVVFRWHMSEGAEKRLLPPWFPGRVVSSDGIKQGSKAKFELKFGGLSAAWIFEHTEYIEGEGFTDRQIKGPFSSWMHKHRFIPENGGTIIEDYIEYKLPSIVSWNYFVSRYIKNEIKRSFEYRNRILEREFSSYEPEQSQKVKKILISGASGLIGNAIIPILRSRGHEVKTLVRREPGQNEIYWNPSNGELNISEIEGFDVVIHLAGENIAEGRWNKAKKESILESRTLGTRLISGALADLDRKPSLLISASAVGYYGDSNDIEVKEGDKAGNLFISEICKEWEKAAEPAEKAGIRTVFSRFGIVLSPKGGALSKLLTPFMFGAGGKIGSGRQYMPWVSIEDAVMAIIYIIDNENIEGPVNIVGPNITTNSEFTNVLAKVLKRPALFPVPALVVKTVFGQMGRELLLSGARVRPEKLLNGGYRFRHNTLEEALRELIGKQQKNESKT